MALRELFHKPAGRGPGAFFMRSLLCMAMVGCADADARTSSRPSASDDAVGDMAAITIPRRRDATPPPGYAWVIFGPDTVVAEVAATADERAEGLMYRDEVPDGTGMLFVFEDSRPRSFWMANTYVALDIAYMDASYRVVDIIAMEPLVTDSYPSSAPAMFGLEVRQGWYEEKGIGIGSQAEIVFGVQGR